MKRIQYNPKLKEAARQRREKRTDANGAWINVLRFRDEDVMNNREGVIAEIKEWIKTHPP